MFNLFLFPCPSWVRTLVSTYPQWFGRPVASLPLPSSSPRTTLTSPSPSGEHSSDLYDGAAAAAPSPSVDYEQLKRIGRDLLFAIGEQPDRPGIADTPRRFADWWCEFIEYAPGSTDTCFESAHNGQMTVIANMRVWSLCEHHLLPFWCDVTIGYIADESVLGLSKFARIAHKHAHRLQLQERLCRDIAQEVCDTLGIENVAVMTRGEHLCMVARGIKTPALMTSTCFHGLFETQPDTRMEFLRLAGAS